MLRLARAPGSRRVVSAGSASRPVHSTGSPDLAAQPAAGIAKSGRSAEATTTASRPACARAADCSLSIARAVAAGLPRRDVGRLQALGLGDVADADHLRAAGLLGAGAAGACRARPPSPRAARRPRVNSTGARSGARRELRGGDARPPVVLVDEHDGGRPRVLRARGVDRLRDGRRRRRPGRRRPRAWCSWSRRPGSRAPGPAGSSSPLWPSTGVPCSARSVRRGLVVDRRRRRRSRRAGARQQGEGGERRGASGRTS